MSSPEPIVVDFAAPDDIWHLSASSIGDALDKPQLNSWAVRETAERTVAQWDAIAAVRAMSHLAAVDVIKEIRFTGKAEGELSSADRGTECHDYLERRLLGSPAKAYTQVELEQLRPYFDRIEAWLAAWQPQPLMTEQVVFDPGNGVAGRLDLILRIPAWERMLTPTGQRALAGPDQLVDLKSSDKSQTRYGRPTRPFGDHGIQLSTYFNATHVATWVPRQMEQDRARFYLANPAELATAAPMPHLDGALILHVTPGHANAHPIECGPDVYRFALCIREAWRWLHHYSKNVVGDVLNPEVPA